MRHFHCSLVSGRFSWVDGCSPPKKEHKAERKECISLPPIRELLPSCKCRFPDAWQSWNHPLSLEQVDLLIDLIICLLALCSTWAFLLHTSSFTSQTALIPLSAARQWSFCPTLFWFTEPRRLSRFSICWIMLLCSLFFASSIFIKGFYFRKYSKSW